MLAWMVYCISFGSFLGGGGGGVGGLSFFFVHSLWTFPRTLKNDINQNSLSLGCYSSLLGEHLAMMSEKRFFWYSLHACMLKCMEVTEK